MRYFSFRSTKLLTAAWCTCLLLFACLAPRKANAQSDYEPAGVLFQDGYLKVELEYKMNNTCKTQKYCKYRYRIAGQPRGYRYINFIMKFYDCDNTITCQPVSLNIADYAGNDGIIGDMNWTFAGFKISVPFMDVKTSNAPATGHSYREPLPVSMAPQGITGDQSIDYGDNTTLQVKGGGLGNKAHWVWYTSQCGGTRTGSGETIAISPKQNTVYYVRAESPTDTTACAKLQVMVNTKSRPADNIEGKSVICKGEQNIPLSISGGKLGLGARWVWYQDSCTGRAIGTGSRINVSPQKNTQYFVRAEGLDNTTECRQLAIRLIDERSKDPDRIQGLDAVCIGQQLELQVTGGKLAIDAEWHWYKDAITPNSEIAKGERIYTKPSANTTYYVRAEGACYTSTERKLVVQVNSPSTQPYNISASAGFVYTGNKVQLMVLGGTLGNNATWVWYKKQCENGRRIGTGQAVSTRVRQKTTYYVRAEGSCNTTNCISYTINPQRKFQFFNIGILPNFRGAAPGGGSIGVNGSMDNAMEQKSYSLTFGQIKRSGWYLRGKYSFNDTKPSYNSNNSALTDYSSDASYYEYNGKVSEKRIGVTGGLLFGITKKWLFVNLGIGYGKRDLLWGIDNVSYQTGYKDQQWAKNVLHSYEGVEVEAGLMLKCWILNVMVGANGIFSGSKSKQEQHATDPFIDLYTGIGFNF
jgi:hypothetical protein